MIWYPVFLGVIRHPFHMVAACMFLAARGGGTAGTSGIATSATAWPDRLEELEELELLELCAGAGASLSGSWFECLSESLDELLSSLTPKSPTGSPSDTTSSTGTLSLWATAILCRTRLVPRFTLATKAPTSSHSSASVMHIIFEARCRTTGDLPNNAA